MRLEFVLGLIVILAMAYMFVLGYYVGYLDWLEGSPFLLPYAIKLNKLLLHAL